MTEPYRILALDGGGLRGIFTAAVLAEAEAAYGPSFLQRFDLMAGTSTGGILALGLASGRTCAEMLRFYRDTGPQIFATPRRIRQAFRPKYDRRVLDDILRNEFGATTLMNDLHTPVCVTAYELVSGTNRVWKDDHSTELRGGGDLPVWKVAAATSAAPTYFAPVQLDAADSHIDGGVWGNNPAMVGLTEAVRYASRDLSDIRMLSIGTTSQALQVSTHTAATVMGLAHWANKALGLLHSSSSAATDNQARLLLGDARYLRIDSDRTRTVKLDDATQCRPLEEWGHNAGRLHVAKIGQLLDLERQGRKTE
ncbi:CBASS cGAMP-activated phospholipase [Mycolicibacterium hodleri]|uniref:CBASS cGAMP-activated phospholipase n=1 Tax=Mycolicibacterium hodleri TaxID=49897 RepID=UPI00163CDE19|nr:CBASS cGAMP-activated phospholipase [Mycolicibacterium hodleri]